jgi:hypothetical protein
MALCLCIILTSLHSVVEEEYLDFSCSFTSWDSLACKVTDYELDDHSYPVHKKTLKCLSKNQGGICRHKYQYCIATSHLTLIVFHANYVLVETSSWSFQGKVW